MDITLSSRQLETINAVISDTLSVSPAQITPDARFIEDLGADSLGVVELGLALEERFNITIPDEMLERNATVGELYEALSPLVRD